MSSVSSLRPVAYTCPVKESKNCPTFSSCSVDPLLYKNIEVGSLWWIRYNDTLRIGKVLEISTFIQENAHQSQQPFIYYVHYLNFDKRLDEWVQFSRFDLSKGQLSDNESTSSTSSSKTSKKRKNALFGCEISSKNQKKTANGFSVFEKDHEEVTKIKNVQEIEFGKYMINTWYYSPFPSDYGNQRKLYFCEHCLKYTKKSKTLDAHSDICEKISFPPGKLIYNEENLVVHEIKGSEEKLYCQNLCLLSKLFLDHKSMYYDVEPFTFYVLYEKSVHGFQLVGYFSKDLNSPQDYNLACILVLPPFQRRGYGKLLISLSYEITKREGKVGTPERPLSDLGITGYRSYWQHAIFSYMKGCDGKADIKDMSNKTGIKETDICSTLHKLDLTTEFKGHGLVGIDLKMIDKYFEKLAEKSIRLANPKYLMLAAAKPKPQLKKRNSFRR